MDRIQCTICQELLMVENTAACQCGHIYHFECIFEWIGRSKSCPQCRMRLTSDPMKLFFNVPDNIGEVDLPTLKNEIQSLKTRIIEKDNDRKDCDRQLKAAVRELKGNTHELDTMRIVLDKSEAINVALKRQLSFLEKHKEEATNARKAANTLQKELDNLQGIQNLVKGERKEVENMLRSYNDCPDALYKLTTSFTILKKEFDMLKEAKTKLADDKKRLRKQMEERERKLYLKEGEVKNTLEQLRISEEDVRHLEKDRDSLKEKNRLLEQSFASPSSRTSAVKRLLMESPAPMELKKKLRRTTPNKSEHKERLSATSESENEDDVKEDVKEIADEFGLYLVNTTSIARNSSKPFLKESNRNIRPKSSESSAGSSLTVIKKGYNGLGGQSKFLMPSSRKGCGKVKVPKSSNNSWKIGQCLKKNPPLPNFFDSQS